ncbi:YbhB/YbcL family Raf kinase inhibitor-like protein [Lactobacillus sp. LC28-10]|uniref:YbhB/YbcL family Raf kinase inhibitor-like protein n=1 Tax=Secundilactobacillus angelensis TaxID=2722706 RepID=A0ABX1KY72_9LACO|nr:YbhB/YbcL family Raf kinase inhibitor-like protein [Secundilactobacillus angelensis]MCH5461735.1 YbhB/YbcL family Raf kinase inhibitor-like protein [Secundilactobacillus angelensis]NLR18574.1 YbhB/YbcL family Raf kinase inhibitor-like protein [Secundilactobacillus angelensis]
MEIKVPVTNGYLPDIYGKYAPKEYRIDDGPVRSFPIEIKDAPAGTETYAVTMIDHDAIPVGGFTWIHWVAANLPGNLTAIPENASQSGDVPMTFGNNSTAGRLVNNQNLQTSQHYTGPLPPDKDHRYTVTVYALDAKLPLHDGFWLNQLHDAMAGHILAEATQVVLGRV